MHLNPVREKAEVIKRVKSDAVLARRDRRGCWKRCASRCARSCITASGRVRSRFPPKIIDVTEDAAGFQYNRRSTNLQTVDMKAYQQIVEAELKRHFETNPTLKKIRAGRAGVGGRHSRRWFRWF